MVGHCCLCKVAFGAVPLLSLHSIPKREDIRNKWLANIGYDVKNYYKVCSRHFREKDFHYKEIGGKVKRFLMPEAVPSASIITPYHSETNEFVQMTTDSEDSEKEAPTTIVYTLKEIMDPDLLAIKGASIKVGNDFNHKNEKKMEKKMEKKRVVHSINLGDSSAHIMHTDDSEYIEGDEKIQSSDKIIPSNYLSSELCDESSRQNYKICDNNSEKSLNLEIDTSLVDGKPFKRKSNRSGNRKNFHVPRYVGDLTREHFTSLHCYNLFQTYYNKKKKNQKLLTEKVNRLTKKIKSLEAVIKHQYQLAMKNSVSQE